METKTNDTSNFMKEREKHISAGSIPLLSGGQFSFMDPRPEMIHAADIAAGLAYKGHFSGITPSFFSIAEHCLLVERIIQVRGGSWEDRLVALLHDAEEAYTGDMPKPLKVLVPGFEAIATKIRNEAIFPRFELDPALVVRIKWADLEAQSAEFEAFYNKGKRMYCMPPESAKHAYLHHLEAALHKTNRLLPGQHIGTL